MTTTVQEETKETVAKVGFAAVMAAAMGPVGIIVAALAVGAERAFTGEGGRQAAQDLSRQQVADQRQWLAEDRAWRKAQREARRAWLDGGGDPELEPARPSKAEAAGRWWRRLWARMVVASDDFRTGFRDGWRAAKDARAGGGSFTEIVSARPDHPDADDLDWSWANEPKEEPPPTRQPEDVAGPRRPPAQDPHEHAPPQGNEPTEPEPEPEPETQEEPVTASTGSTPQGESNATILGHKLRGIGNTMTKVEAGVDDLGRLADALAAQVREAYEFATHTGQIAATKQALDAANAVVTRLRALVIAASEAAVEAVEQVAAARGSLRVAETAEDSLRAAGGTGDAVATAKAA